MKTARDVIDKFGGENEMARKLTASGAKPVAQSVIHYWVEMNCIPRWRVSVIMAAAKKFDISLSQEERLAILRTRDEARMLATG